MVAPAQATVAIEPLHDRIVILPDEAEAVSKGGILLPDTAKRTATRGTVVAVGPGQYEYQNWVLPTCHVGDRILFYRYSGVSVDMGDKVYLILKDSDVLARLP